MSQRAVELFLGRITGEEGEKLKPYDDATAKPVVAPVGNLSWGHGYNLMACGSPGLFAVMDRYLAEQVDTTLQAYAWYRELDSEPTRQSVLLDIAYNAGAHGLLHFPSMLAFCHARDWQNAAVQCSVAKTNPGLDASRYAPLRSLLLHGDTAP